MKIFLKRKNKQAKKKKIVNYLDKIKKVYSTYVDNLQDYKIPLYISFFEFK